MKIWLILVTCLLILFLITCQILIPKTIDVSRSVTSAANVSALFRFLSNDANWNKYWPETEPGATLRSGDFRFKKHQVRYRSVHIQIEKNGNIDNSLLNLLPLGSDSVEIVWTASLHAARNNPFSKISLYLYAQKVGRHFQTILRSLNSYAGQVKNLYGFDIRQDKIQLEYLATTRKTIPHYPTTDEIYDMIHSIKEYIAGKPIKIMNRTIMHIQPVDSVHYDVLVAVPVDRQIPDSSIFVSKKLLRNGNILVTEATGGNFTVQQALKQIETFATDYGLRNIAVPYRSFLVDRTQVTDSTKWRTLVVYPVL